MAEGKAQLYPRFGPTNIWDTGAGHAVAIAAGAHVHDWKGRPLDYAPRESFLNRAFASPSSELVKQLVQQGDHLLHLLLRQRAIFNKAHPPILIQHHHRRAAFLQLPGAFGDAVAVDDKLRPRILLLLFSILLRTNIPVPGMASSVLIMVVVW